MNYNTFVADFSGHMTLVTGFTTLAMVTIWVLCGKIMPAKIQKEILAKPAKKDYFQRGINDFLDIAKKAKLFAIWCGIVFLGCLYGYLRFTYGW